MAGSTISHTWRFLQEAVDSLVDEVWDCPECQASKPKRRGTATDRQRAAEQQKAAVAAAVAAQAAVGRRVKAGERKRKEREEAAPEVLAAAFLVKRAMLCQMWYQAVKDN